MLIVEVEVGEEGDLDVGLSWEDELLAQVSAGQFSLYHDTWTC